MSNLPMLERSSARQLSAPSGRTTCTERADHALCRNAALQMPERNLSGLAAIRQGRRHEAQFDKGLYPDRQQEVADLVGVEERVEQFVALAHERANFITPQPVKAGVPKAEQHSARAQLLLPVSAQGQRRVAAAEGVLPEVGQ
nr:hypothetical protein [Variovorax sp. LG9.2]